MPLLISDLGRIFRRRLDTATYTCSFKHPIHNCDKTAADRHMVTNDSI